ncbi:MAG: dTDP-glucose 4,6-dehydratase [Phycisphaerae bacterium]|nr:dTDP-glucose 4,6-dehydratase [Phycisphaerae bacterium]
MRVLIAGCAGFIGYHFTERCVDEGLEVVGVDNLATGQNANVEHLHRHEQFAFAQQSITQPLKSEGPLAGRFDWVCNFACPASPVDFKSKRLDILEVCSRGTWNLLELARRQNARFLQTSTSEVYGDPKEHPQKETYWGHVNPIGPRSCYDEGKRFAEALTVAYRDELGVETRIVRIFNTYGPRMRSDDGRALPNFINQALDNQPITIHGDGKQTRSFCFVSDLVEGIIRLVRSDVRDPVNIGNPVEVTIGQIAREVVELAGSRSEIVFVERPTDDPQVRRPDITRAQTLLKWKPIVERRDGLALTIEWFRQARASDRAARG